MKKKCPKKKLPKLQFWLFTAIIDKLSGHVVQPTGLHRFISTNVYRFKTNSKYRTYHRKPPKSRWVEPS